jgi:hypothetical protein
MTAAAEEMDEVVVVAYGRAESFLLVLLQPLKERVSRTEQLQTFFLE